MATEIKLTRVRLNINGVDASFVLFEAADCVNISARSLGQINVQVIMERLGGGGHLNVAGAQVDGSTIEEVERSIMDILDKMIKKGEIVL